MFAPIALDDLSWPDPQFGGPDAILKYMACSEAYMQIPTATSNDVVQVGPVLEALPLLEYYGSAISKNGLIAACPLLATRVLYIDTNNDSVATGSVTVTPPYDSMIYCSYNDSFYCFGGNQEGIVEIAASNTGSHTTYTSLQFSQGGYVDQNLIYLRQYRGNLVDQILLTFDVNTKTTSSVAQIPFEEYDQMFLSAENIMFFKYNTSVNFYDFNTNTTGSCTGTYTIDTATGFSLMPDGNFYSVPFFEGNSVYKLDPRTKTITTEFSGSPYIGGGSARNRFVTQLPNNTILNWNNVNPFNDVAYNYENNTAESTNFVFDAGFGALAIGSATMAKNAIYTVPASAQYVQKFNLVDYQELLNAAVFSSPINTF